MKRIIFIATIVVAAIVTTAFIITPDEKPIRFDQLPSAAKTFVTKNFPTAKVLLVVKDGLLFPDYEVKLNNKTSIDFDHKGRMTKIESLVPGTITKFLPNPIQKYILENFKDRLPVKYEYDSDDKKYEVKLQGGLELTFDASFRLVDIDD